MTANPTAEQHGFNTLEHVISGNTKLTVILGIAQDTPMQKVFREYQRCRCLTNIGIKATGLSPIKSQYQREDIDWI